MKDLRRKAVAVTLSIYAGVQFCPTFAAEPSRASNKIRFEIPQQPLASALNELALQAHQRIVFIPDVVRGLQSREISGELTLEEAIDKLLNGTQLSVSYTRDGIIMIFRARRRDTPSLPVSMNQQENPELEEVVITGSRVITDGNDSPMPVTVMTVEDARSTRPTTVFEGLLDLPQFAGSRSVFTNPGNAGADNNNISALSLRGLGQSRTLILYDGHRVPPAQQNGYVNANSVPQMLLQRVDIVTGGVSAVYGSDAISGVVNFISNRHFNGIKIDTRYGLSEFDDDESYKFGIAGGMDLFGGRGHLQGSYETHDDAGVLQRTARQFGRERWTLQGSGTVSRPYFLVPYARLGNTTFGGLINGPVSGPGGANPFVNQQFVAPGVLGSFMSGSTAGLTGNIQLGGDGAYFTSSSLKAKLDFHQLYGRFDVDLRNNLHFFLTGAGMLEHSFNYNTNNRLNAVTLSATNAFLPTAYQQQLTSRGITTFTLSKMWDLGTVPPAGADDYTRQWWLNTGLEGELGEYRWELSLTRSESRMKNRQDGAIDNGRLSAALDAVVNPANNQIVCQVLLTSNAGLYPGCVPIDVFGAGTESRAAIDYIIRRSEFQPQIDMVDVSTSLAGEVFDNWSGPISMALSGEWRRLDYQLLSNSLPAAYDPLLCTGLRFNCSGAGATAKATTAVIFRPPVNQTVSEVAIEAEIPLVEERLFAESASLNTAYRYARYSQTGSPIFTQQNKTRTFGASTWKAGLTWHFTNAVTARATRSRDFRAPNLNDLYAPGLISTTANLTDTLTNTTPLAQTQSGGNPNLRPEVSDTMTAGLVFKASQEFSIAVDAFKFRIKDALSNVSGNSNLAQDQCYASGGTSFFCSLQERPVSIATAIANPVPINAVTKWYTSVPLNIAVEETWGADIEANWRSELAGHALSLRGLMTYQPHSIQVLPGATTLDFAAVDFSNNNQAGAVWRMSVFAHYAVSSRLSVDWLTRWRSALHHSADPNVIVGNGDPDRNPPVAFSNLNLSYKFDRQHWGQWDAYLNIQNVFNQQSYPTANAGPQGNPGNFGGPAPGDDAIGRYYSVGMRISL